MTGQFRFQPGDAPPQFLVTPPLAAQPFVQLVQLVGQVGLRGLAGCGPVDPCHGASTDVRFRPASALSGMSRPLPSPGPRGSGAWES
ncbi:hypothetical protein WP39_22570 [Streptomyces sp. 604F]|nr:hypothetical protein [Streptomyces sp. 604F]